MMAAAAALLITAAPLLTATAPPPHLFMFIVDDLGYGNVNWNRDTPTPEIVTPTMDALVADGIHLQRFYVFSCCRCAAIAVVYTYARLVQNL